MNLSESAQARLNQRTHMIYYSSQLIETDQQRRTFLEKQITTQCHVFVHV